MGTLRRTYSCCLPLSSFRTAKTVGPAKTQNQDLTYTLRRAFGIQQLIRAAFELKTLVTLRLKDKISVLLLCILVIARLAAADESKACHRTARRPRKPSLAPCAEHRGPTVREVMHLKSRYAGIFACVGVH